jgi:hypothetical protein
MSRRRRGRGFALCVLLAGLAGALLALPAPASRAASPTLRLSPTSGPPGTVVTLDGFVPGLTAPPPAYAGVEVCIDGCATGFTAEGLPFHWLGGGRFTATFRLPTVPVLTASGPLVWRDGPIRIGFTCFGPDVAGCANRTQASATFTVTGAHPTTCTTNRPCAELTVTPARAEPGQLLSVRGYAPLSPLIGRPFGYQLVLSRPDGPAAPVGQVQQDLDGRVQGSFRLPLIVPGLGAVGSGRFRLSLQYQFNQVPAAVGPLPPDVRIVPKGKVTAAGTFGYELVTLAATPFTVLPSPTWASLGRLTPKSVQWSMALPLAARADTLRDMAVCVPGGIRLTSDGGRTWRLVATAGAVEASMAGPFPIAYDLRTPASNATCTSVVWDPNDPETLYASFNAIRRPYGSAPPLYSVLYETRDGGRTWRPVPVPKGYVEGDFGGVTVLRRGAADAVEVVFGRGEDATSTTAATAEVTTDGGATWHLTGLSCPDVGPCVRFGAMPGQLPGMGASDLQPLVASTDGGRSWRTLAWPTGNVLAQGLVPSGQSELVWLGGENLAFVDATSPFPLCLSADGGRTWRPIALPWPPGSAAALAAGTSPYEVLMWLPDGELLAATSGAPTVAAHWWLLGPGASRWVADPGLRAPVVFGRLLVVANRLLWADVSPSGGGATSVRLESAPLPRERPGAGTRRPPRPSPGRPSAPRARPHRA